MSGKIWLKNTDWIPSTCRAIWSAIQKRLFASTAVPSLKLRIHKMNREITVIKERCCDMPEPIVLYHGNCWDGFCAAWLFHKVWPDGDYIPVQYGQQPPDIAVTARDRPLFVVDFSYSRSIMFELGAMRPGGLTVLDHHKTAQAALDGLSVELGANNCGSCEVVFDMNKSGGRLAWEFLWEDISHLTRGENWDWARGGRLSKEKAPWLVEYTEDRDLWKWELPDSKAITTCLRSHPLDFDLWDDFDNIDPETFIAEGEAILRSEATIIDTHVRHAREIELGGHKILAVNATVLFSDIAGRLAEGRPFGAAYFDRGDGKRQWSLRSTDAGVDVSEIAKDHGGGGHRNAAGFETTVL